MDQPSPVAQAAPRPCAGNAVSVLWRSAVEAAIQAWLVLLFGRIAFGLVGGIFQKMLPSAPPGFSASTAAESDSLAMTLWDTGRLAAGKHKLLLLFLLLFALTAWMRLAPRRQGQSSKAGKVLGRLSDNWFSLLVGNAFGAMIAAYVLVWAQFSFEKWMLKELLVWGFSRMQDLVQWVSGQGTAGAFQHWREWVSENQFKFTFWFLFIAAVSDDLGLPNLKTMGRRLWRRARARLGREPAAVDSGRTPLPG